MDFTRSLANSDIQKNVSNAPYTTVDACSGVGGFFKPDLEQPAIGAEGATRKSPKSPPVKSVRTQISDLAFLYISFSVSRSWEKRSL